MREISPLYADKTLFTLVMALLAALISITFNIKPVEAMTMLNQWQQTPPTGTSTGLIALRILMQDTVKKHKHKKPLNQK